MGRVICMPIYCCNVKDGRYKASFEEVNHEDWYGVKAEALDPLTRSERQALLNAANPQPKKRGFFSSLLTPKEREIQAPEFRGTFNNGELSCPLCGNRSFVKCGNCKNLTCYDDSGYFTCAICGSQGEVSGYIDSMNGDTESNVYNGPGNTLR